MIAACSGIEGSVVVTLEVRVGPPLRLHETAGQGLRVPSPNAAVKCRPSSPRWSRRRTALMTWTGRRWCLKGGVPQTLQLPVRPRWQMLAKH